MPTLIGLNTDEPFTGLRKKLPDPFAYLAQGKPIPSSVGRIFGQAEGEAEELAKKLARAIVVIESPFAAQDEWEIELNKAYARECCRWALLNGLVPLASHLLYTQMLDDKDPIERVIGIEAGLRVNAVAAKATLVFLDRGLSSGMEKGIQRSLSEGRPVHALKLPGWRSP